MKISAILSALICAEIAIAAPFTEMRRERNRRLISQRKTNPKMPADDGVVEAIEVGNSTAHVQYSSNWAGGVLVGTGFTKVTGTIVVPTPKTPSGGSSRTEYAASAWVGIDGDTCTTAILQTGVDFYVQGTSVSFDAWYEWYPDYAYNFANFAISAGNTITMTVTATSKGAGSAVITNVSTGKTVTHTFSGESNQLCETNAEWIVEDFESNGGLVPFANFGTVTFTGASAIENGQTVTPSGAQILDIKQGNTVLTSCSAGSTVSCTYT